MIDDLSYEDLVHRVAQCHGIEPEYYDIWGNLHAVPIEVKKALLGAMGISADTRESLEAALFNKENGEWLRMLPTVAVITRARFSAEGIPFHLRSRGPSAGRLPEDTTLVSVTLHEECGTERELRVSEDSAVWEGERQINGTWYERYRLRCKEELECGYFRLRMTVDGFEGGSTCEAPLIVCPERAYLPEGFSRGTRYAGLQVPLFSIHSQGSWGAGDFRDLRSLAEWAVGALGVDFIGLNPLHATFNRSPLNISPYNPLSRIFRNFIYLSVEEIPEFMESREAQNLFSRIVHEDTWREMVHARRVDFQRVSSAKKRVLEKVFETFLERHWRGGRAGDLRAEDFQAFRKEKGESLELCATFLALEEYFSSKESHAVPWGQWPEAYRDCRSSEIKTFQQQHEDRILFYSFLQWQIDEQMRKALEQAHETGLSMGFYLDTALGVDPWGADRWIFQEVFARGVTVGAPPDDFSPKGQNWGIPPLIPDRLKETGYRLFIETIRENCAHASMLRLDHVMGMFRLFWIPEGCLPVEGAYVRMPAEDMLGILALESHRNSVIVIGEDLGTVPPYIRERLKDANALSYRLFYFERSSVDEWKSPSEYPSQALVSISTHDLPTLKGYWECRDILMREQLGLFADPVKGQVARQERDKGKRGIFKALNAQGLLPEGFSTLPEQLTEELQRAVMAYLVRTPCWLLLLNHEDIFMDEDQLNLPGTLTEYPNWTSRMRYSLEELAIDPRVRSMVEAIRCILKGVNAGNP